VSETLEWFICDMCKSQVNEVASHDGKIVCEDCFAELEDKPCE